MSRSPWTTEEDRQLRKLAQAGLSLTEIAREVGRNQSSVRVRAIKLDIAIARDLNGMQRRKLRERPSESG
jgi:IS30 family transposase